MTMASPKKPAARKDGTVHQPVILPYLRPLGEHQIVILVAEPQVMVRNLVTLLMQGEGYFVLSASDGAEGLELSQKYSGVINLLITGWKMPRLSGSDLYTRIVKERPGIKVLVMTSADTNEIVAQNAHLPFLPTPFDGDALKDKVWALLTGSVSWPKPEHPGLGASDLKTWLVAERAWESSRK
jgi:DNA-binding response OmpR family regulator